MLATRVESTRQLPVKEDLSDDANLVLSACEALQAACHQDGLNIDNEMLSATTETLVGTLSYPTVLKLAILTWHFDASGSPTEDLHRFLQNPNRDNKIWQAVHQSYVNMKKEDITLRDFKGLHDFLLYSVL